MADQSVVSNSDWWTKVLTGWGAVLIGIGGAYNILKAHIAKRRKPPAPVGWEDTVLELRKEMARGFSSVRTDMVAGLAAAAQVSGEAHEQVSRLREYDLVIQKRRIDRIESEQAQDRDENRSILERIDEVLKDVRILKGRWRPDVSKDPNRIPE